MGCSFYASFWAHFHVICCHLGLCLRSKRKQGTSAHYAHSPTQNCTSSLLFIWQQLLFCRTEGLIYLMERQNAFDLPFTSDFPFLFKMNVDQNTIGNSWQNCAWMFWALFILKKQLVFGNFQMNLTIHMCFYYCV